MSCLKSLVHRGNEVLEKYFVAKFDEERESAVGGSKIGLELEPVPGEKLILARVY